MCSLSVTIAWRNIWRNPRRTLLTLAAVGFATAVMVFFVALQLSSYQTSIDASTRVFHGHLQVQTAGYLKKPQIRLSIESGSVLARRVQTLPGIHAAGVRAFQFALVSSQDRSYGVQVVGVEPEVEDDISTVPSLIREGSYLDASDAQGLVLGTQLAKNLKIKVGDELTLLGQGYDGSLAAEVYRVRGIFETLNQQLDRNVIEIPLSSFQTVFSMPDRAHSIVIRVNDARDIARLQGEIASLLPEEKSLQVYRWDEIIPGLKQAIELDMATGRLFYLSLVLVVSFTVLNTFLMSVLERTKEFGVLLALGMRPLRIMKLILIECISLSALGILIGIVFGSMIVFYFGQVGFQVPGSEEIARRMNLSSKVFPEVSFKALSQGPLLLLFVSFLSALYPAFRVLKIDPSRATREH